MKQNLLKISEDIPQTLKTPHSVLKQKESEDSIEVHASIEAGDTPIDAIEHALSTGRNHIKYGKHTYLLTKELRNKTAKIQRQSSGNPEAPLLVQSNYSVSRFQSTALRGNTHRI